MIYVELKMNLEKFKNMKVKYMVLSCLRELLKDIEKRKKRFKEVFIVIFKDAKSLMALKILYNNIRR